MRVSGTYDPFEYILRHHTDLFPVIRNYAAFYATENGLIHCIGGERIEISEFEKVAIQKIRNKRIYTYEWVDSLNINDLYAEKFNQQSLYSEEKLQGLAIYLPSLIDSKSNCIIFQIEPNATMQIDGKEFKGMTISEKSILSLTIFNVIKFEFNRIINERNILRNIGNFTKTLEFEKEELNSSLILSVERSKSLMNSIFNEILIPLNQKFNCEFKIDSSIYDFFIKNAFSISSLNKIIEEAASVSYALNFTKQEIFLSKSHLNLSSLESQKIDFNTNNSDKIIDLLDRYEQAAERLQRNKETINGKNIAKALNPPVSPPAINDAIRKNEKKIIFYLKENKNRWPLIENNLKTIERLKIVYGQQLA